MGFGSSKQKASKNQPQQVSRISEQDKAVLVR